MSTRAFARTLPDQVNFSPGNAPANQGNMTAMVLLKTSDLYGWFLAGNKAGSSVWAMGRDTGKWFTWNDFGAGVTFDPAGHWCWVGFTRGSGNARWHFKDYTAGGAWQHVDSGFNPGNGTGPIDAIQVSGYGGGGVHILGSVAVAFTANSALSDAAIQAACTSNAADALAAANWMTLWNQTSTATAITDVTGGGGNQSSITGTSIDADEPPSFNWSLGPSTTPVSRTLSAPWNVRSTVSRSLSAPWSLRAAVSRSLSMPWTLRASVSGSLDVRWAQRAVVAQSLSVPWSVRGVVGGTLDVRWALRSQISTLLGTPWIVRKRVTSNLQTLWVVEGAPLPTTKVPSVGTAALTERVTAYGPERITAYL